MNRAVRTGLGLAMLTAVVTAVSWVALYRYSARPLDGAFHDLRDAGYYAARSLLDGNNPYDHFRYLATYPVAQEFPLLLPTYAVLHVPLLVFDLLPAAIVFTALSMAGIVALSAWSLRFAGWPVTVGAVAAVSALAIASNGGRLTLNYGQATVLWVAASYVALTATDDRIGAGGLALAITKPTFGLPLAVMLTGLRRAKRAVVGVAVAAVASLPLLLLFVSWAGGIESFLASLRANLRFSQGSESGGLATTMERVDAVATVRQLTGWVAPSIVEILVAVVVIGGIASILATNRDAPRDAAIVLVCVAVLFGVYHLYYDMLLLLLPTLLVLHPSFAGGVARQLRLTLLVALLVANFNVFHTSVFIDRVPEGVGRLLGPGLTGIALAVALACALSVVRSPVRDRAHVQ